MHRKHHQRYQERFSRLRSLARSLTASSAAGLLLALATLLVITPAQGNAQSATYRVTFEGKWTTTATATGVAVPSGSHFSPLIGAVHNDSVTFWSVGGTASAGIESMAEVGGTSALKAEITAAGSDASSAIQRSGNIGATATVTVDITLSPTHPLVTLVTMIAPSPDWFVGVSGLSLLNAQNEWLASHAVDLFPYDAGTEDGTEFSLSNDATDPQGTITSIKGMGKFSNAPIATLTFTRQSVNTAPSFTSETGARAVAENTARGEDIGDAFQATDPDTGDTVRYSLGGPDATSFAIVASSGQLRTKAALDYETTSSYAVTVTATDNHGLSDNIDVTITVTNADEEGTVSLFPAQPRVGTVLKPTVSDPDGIDRTAWAAVWKWERSSDQSSWEEITHFGPHLRTFGEAYQVSRRTNYAPAPADLGKYLRATVTYIDQEGPGKTVESVLPQVVGADAAPEITVVELVSGLTHPWGLAFAPDGTMLFTERGGGLNSRLPDGTVQTISADLSELGGSGERGMLGLVVDPAFATNRRFYTCSGHTGLSEMQVIGWSINDTYTEAVRIADPLVGGIPMGKFRNGCRLRFGPAGYLWITTGDAQVGTGPQDLASLGGKVLRVDPSTGAGAPTNPFAQAPLVYTYGHRNPQGLARRPGTSQMWSVEHGTSQDDEINLLVSGGNYGWDPDAEPGYRGSASMTDLEKFPQGIEAKWSSGYATPAASGGIFLEGSDWGEWEGRLAVATLKTRSLRIFDFTANGTFVSQVVVPELDGTYGRLRSPMMGPDGALYVTTSNGGGADRILRIAEDTTAPTVSMVAISSNPGPDQNYAIGEAIEVTVTFDETVVVTGLPRLSLTVGTQTKPATYARGSNSDTLVFGYEVSGGDEDTDGVSVEADSLSPNGGTIKDGADNDAVLDHEAVVTQAGHKVDGVKPTLAATGGAVVNGATLTLTYDEPLDGSSTPAASAFTVAGGSESRTVTGARMSGSKVELTLDPAVEQGETGIQVNYTVPTGIGASPIRDVPGNEAIGLSSEPVTNETPDTIAPTVSMVEISSDPGSDRIYVPEDEIQATVTFSEPVDVERTPRLMLRVGERNRPAGYVDGTGTAELVFGYEVVDGDEDADGVSIDANSLSFSGGTIKDGSKNSAVLDHDGLAADSGHKVDGAGPDLAETDGAVANAATLTLTFDESLDRGSTPLSSAFTVTGGDASRTVTGVALSGNAVLLTLNPTVEHGETGIRVSYTVPTGTGARPLQDVLGNDAGRLRNVPATNETPDTTPPTVSKVEISSNPGTDRTYAAEEEIQVTVTFSETVEVTGTPQLSLELGGVSRTASYEGGSGTAALVFAYEVAEAESDTDGVGVEADSLSGGTIEDTSDNPAELDHDGLVADSGHKVDGVRPALASTGGAVVNGTVLTLTFDEALDGGSTPASGDFTVPGGDQTRTVSRVSVSGSTVALTLDVGAEHLETGIQVSYTPGTNRIRDVPGNEAEALSREPVTNETPDTTPPEVISLSITSNPGSDLTYAAEDTIEVTVTFSETVEVEGTPQLRLRVGTRTRTAGYLRGRGTAALVFGYEVADGDEDSDGVSVQAGRIALNGGTIKDEADNPAELDHEAVAVQMGHRVDGVRPAFVSAAVDGSSLTLTYGEALDTGSRPASGDFTVEVGGSGRSVGAVSISGSVVTLTLNPEVEHGETGIRVSYTPGTSPIQDAMGNDALALSNRPVTNTTDAPNTAPEITTRGTLSVRENQSVVRRLAARDSDAGDEVTGWDIVGGADQLQFSITSDRGDLSFREAADYEVPTDVASSDPVSGAGDNEYVVRVRVRSGAGARELEAEQTLTVRVTDEQERPGVPEVPVISGETVDTLTVSWREPDNTGPPITDYDVQYRENGVGSFRDGGHEGPGLSTTLSSLKAGTDYEVQVRARNEEGTSGWSPSGEGKTIALLTLEMETMEEPPVSGEFGVRLSFSEEVTGFSAGDVDSNQDPACVDEQNNTVLCDPQISGLQTGDNRVFTARVTPWTSQVAHSYRLNLRVLADTVTASVSGQGNEEGILRVRVSPPGAPEPISSMGLQASPGGGSVRLSWNRPTDNGGSAIIRYEYRHAPTGGEWSEWEKVGARSGGVTVENLITGNEYMFEVRAVNALGKGGAETAMAVPERRIAPPRPPPAPRPPGNGDGGGLLFPPEAPAGLMAMPGEGAVRLEWSPPASDGGTPILRYEYRLKEGRGGVGEWTPIEDSAPGEVNAAGYTVMGLGNGTVYAIELRGVNLVGKGRVSEAVEVVMLLDRAYWSNFRGEELQGSEASLEHTLFGGTPRSLRLRFGAGLRFEEDELDGEGEVTGTRAGSYGYRYTSRTTGELSLDYDGGEACQLRLTFRGVGAGSYSYRGGGRLGGQGSFRLSGLNRGPEITSTGPFEVVENQAMVMQLEAVDPDEGDGIEGYGIAGGADGALFRVVEETGELMFGEAPDYETPGDVASGDPQSGAGDNEYIVVVEVRSGEGERERKGQRAIRVRVSDEQEPPEITGAGVFEVAENRMRVGRLEAVDPDAGDEIRGYGIAGGADASLFVIEAETGELSFREAPDYEAPGDVESADPQSGAGDNEYVVVVEVWSGEGERERKGSRAIRVRVTDEEEPPEIIGAGVFEVVENRTRVGRMEAVDPDKQDEITEYGIAGGADGGLFAVESETGELSFREAPDYETPSDVENEEPQSGAGDNEYVVVVEVWSGEGERQRKRSRAIRVRVTDEEELPGAPAAPAVTAEGSGSLKVSWTEPENHGPEITDYEVRYREGGEAGYSDGGHQGTGLTVRLSGLKEGTVYEVQVRAVNEEGMSEWSEPGEGRTDTEDPDPDDPSNFTGEELEGRRLTLRITGEEGAAGSLELRFGEGNRFEQTESGGQQAATRSEGAARSGSYTYERTGPGMGTLRLAYDDGNSCEVSLAFTEVGAGTFSYDCGEGGPAEGSFRLTTGSLFVPVILSAAGQNQSFFTSELTLTNRGEREARLDYSYTAHIGGGSGRASEVLAPGRQKIETDALGYLVSARKPRNSVNLNGVCRFLSGEDSSYLVELRSY